MSVDWARSRTVFGTNEPIKPSRSYTFLGQISHPISSTQIPTHQCNAETQKAVLFSKPLQQISPGVICRWAYPGRRSQELCKIQAPLHLVHPSDPPGLSVYFRRKLDGSDKTALHKAMLIITYVLWSYGCLQIDFLMICSSIFEV